MLSEEDIELITAKMTRVEGERFTKAVAEMHE